MTRAGLITLISHRFQCSRALAAELVDQIYEEMETDLLQGKPLRLAGIATLRVRVAAARRNLIQAAGEKAGTSADVDARTTGRAPRYRLTLRPSTAFRQRLATLNATSMPGTTLADRSTGHEKHEGRPAQSEPQLQPDSLNDSQPERTASFTPQPSGAGLETT